MIAMLRQYNGDSIYLLVFAVSLIALAWIGRKQKEDAKVQNRALLSVVLAIVCIYNGAAYYLIGKLTDTTTYYRFFWMLPVIFVIAYVVTGLYTSKKGWERVAGVLLLVVCMAWGGNFFLRPSNWNHSTNLYGLSQDAIDIAEAIRADYGESDLTQANGPVAAFDFLLEYQTRSYDPTIRWGLTRQAYLWQAEHGYDYKNGKYRMQQRIIAAVNEGKKEDGAALRRCIDKRAIQYLVIRTDYDMDDYLQPLGIEAAAKSDNYTLYRVH